MIKVVYGNKGVGKTKYLIAAANTLLESCTGDIVFINHVISHITNIKQPIRYVDISDFPIKTMDQLLSFICGMISQNYDIKAIFVDGLSKYQIAKEEYPYFFEQIKILSDKFDTQFTFSISGDISNIPDFVYKEYSC
jgi:ABC-type proline/glycine betaine transport system ATPase subunit